MGVISFILNNKEIVELEEIIPILWDKIDSFYIENIRKKCFRYVDNDLRNSSLRRMYGNGKIIKPEYDFPDYLEEMLEKLKEEEGIEDSGEMVVIKNNDYNYFMMSLAEFAKKSNRYIYLMSKSNLQISINMRNIFNSYQKRVDDIKCLYKYVVE